jgi:hypothetical protein
MEKKTTKIGLELKEGYYSMGTFYMKGSLWSKKGEHENYEIAVDTGELLKWVKKNNIIEKQKDYINLITD